MIATGTRNTPGDGTAVALADPATNRLKVGPFVQLQNKGASDVNVKLKLGAREIYDVLLEPKGAVLITDFSDDAGNRAWLGYLLRVAIDDAIGALSGDTITKLTSLLGAKVQSVTVQPATLPGPSIAAAAGFPVVTAAQVQGALNA